MFRSILLIDDHAAILEGLRNLLATRFANATFRIASSSAEAKSLLSQEEPDLVILDVAIGRESGLDLIPTIQTQAPKARVLMYSMHPEHEFGLKALRAGAHGYLTKDRPISDLMEALNRMGSGRRYIGPQLAESLAEAVATEERRRDSRKLSERESQILKLVADGKALKEIAGDLGVSIKTVSTYRARILVKLGMSTTADLIRYAVAQNL